jgi:4-hydroxybenzoate polyprenyltransferase
MNTPAPRLPAFIDILRALRVNQWTKNLVVLAAIFFAFGDRTQSVSLVLFIRVGTACALFCLASSGIYLINDILDRAADALHPIKRFRPIAAGKVRVLPAAVLSAVLLVSAVLGTLWLSRGFALIVGGYIVLQITYTLWLKHVALVDVFIIALGFVLRAAGGGVVVNVPVSPWLLLCAFLLALFLALCKRRHEKLLLDEDNAQHRPSLERYDQKLLDQLIAIVSAATLVCYSIYTLWPETILKFGTPLLSLTIPLVIFGIFRYLDLVYRKEGGGRPERILLTDGPLLIDLALYGLTVLGIFVFSR